MISLKQNMQQKSEKYIPVWSILFIDSNKMFNTVNAFLHQPQWYSVFKYTEIH